MGAHKKGLTTKQICQELGLTIKQLRRIMAAHPDGEFTVMGRCWKATKQGSLSNSPYIFDEIATSTAADKGEDDDLRSMTLDDLKREKYIAEIKTIRQKWREERARMRKEIIDELDPGMREILTPLREALKEVVRDPGDIARLRGIIDQIIQQISDKPFAAETDGIRD